MVKSESEGLDDGGRWPCSSASGPSASSPPLGTGTPQGHPQRLMSHPLLYQGEVQVGCRVSSRGGAGSVQGSVKVCRGSGPLNLWRWGLCCVWGAGVRRVIHHFDLKTFRPNERDRVKVSLAACAAFALVGFPLIIAKFGILGWVNLWLMPWLGFHFWVSQTPSSAVLYRIQCITYCVQYCTVVFSWNGDRMLCSSVTESHLSTVWVVGGDGCCADEHIYDGAPHRPPHPLQECQAVEQRPGPARGHRALRLPYLVCLASCHR